MVNAVGAYLHGCVSIVVFTRVDLASQSEHFFHSDQEFEAFGLAYYYRKEGCHDLGHRRNESLVEINHTYNLP